MRTPRVGVSVADPPATTVTTVHAGETIGVNGSLVAVSGVVVRLGSGEGVSVSVAVRLGDAIRGVDVIVGGAGVGEERAASVCATEVFAAASVPAIFTVAVGCELGVGVKGRQALKTNAATATRAIFFIMRSSCGYDWLTTSIN